MTREEIAGWVETRFSPLQLSIEEPLLLQTVDDAIRYWNTHSAFPVVSMFNISPTGNSGQAGVQSSATVQLTAEFKDAVEVYPASQPTQGFIWQDHPMWSLLGLTLLDSITYNLIEMTHYYQNFRVYVGSDFRWRFMPSMDPTEGGTLYTVNFPLGVTQVCVIGSKRIVADENIKNEHILNWVLNYTYAIVKQLEGAVLRKASIIGINNDGNDLIREGAEMQKSLEDKLSTEGLWAITGRRI